MTTLRFQQIISAAAYRLLATGVLNTNKFSSDYGLNVHATMVFSSLSSLGTDSCAICQKKQGSKTLITQLS